MDAHDFVGQYRAADLNLSIRCCYCSIRAIGHIHQFKCLRPCSSSKTANFNQDEVVAHSIRWSASPRASVKKSQRLPASRAGDR